MVGIILVSHGNMAHGVLDAASMIFPNQDNICSIGLDQELGVEELRKDLKEKLELYEIFKEIYIFTDLRGGTPFNESLVHAMVDERIKVFSGMNLAMVLEFLGQRMLNDIDIDRLIDASCDNIAIANVTEQDSDDDF